MKKFFLSAIILIFSFNAQALEIKSPEIKSGSTISDKHIFNNFGCKGENISPKITWKDAPKDTKSFALTVYDPDAPTGSGWWHWLLINIPANYKEVSSNFGKEDKFDLKDGIKQVRNDFGLHKFGGPCPPVGDKPHRYIFTIYALKTDKIDIDKSATAAFAGYMINQNSLEKKSFEAFFGR